MRKIVIIFIAILMTFTACGKEKVNKDVQYLNDCIEVLDESSITSKAYIEDLMNKYEALSESDKKKVKDIDKVKAVRDKIALKEAMKDAEAQAEKERKEREDKEQREKAQKEKEEKDALSDVKSYIQKAQNENDTFLVMIQGGKNYQDTYSYITAYSNYNKNTKDYLDKAYNSCGSYSSMSNLKSLINKARNALPMSISSNTQQAVIDYLNDLEYYVKCMYEVEMEIANIR